MSREKLLIVITPFYGHGGGARRLTLWARYFRRHFDVHILSNEFDGVGQKMGPGLPMHYTRSLNPLPRRLVAPAAAGLSKYIISNRPRYIISNYPWAIFLTSVALEVARRVPGRKVTHLAHVAGRPQWENSPAVARMLSHWMMRYAYNACDCVMSVSDYDRRHIVQTYDVNEDKTRTVPIGIEWPERPPRTRGNDPFHFGVVARLSWEKGIDKCLAASRRLATETTRAFHLHVFGDGPERGRLEARSRSLGIDDVVTFHGFVADPFSAIAQLDCLVLYSDTEGTPRSILEAGAYEVPVIARDVGGVSEVVRHEQTGYLVDTEEQLRERMHILLNNPTLAESLGRRAKAFVCSRHTMEHEISQIESLMR